MMIDKKILFLASLFLVLAPNVALSDVPNQGALDSILQVYINAASTWEATLTQYAIRLFWILVLIDFVWMAINLALNPGEFSDITINLIRKILFIGFFYALLLNGPTWAKSIIDSFQVAANTLTTTTSSTPSGIFGMGFNLAVKIFDAISVRHPVDSLGYVIAGYIIMIVFALIAAMVLLVTVQIYIILYAGVLLLGFGGSTFTKDIALNYLKAALSVGAKLFIMLLITRLGTVVVDNWIHTFHDITFKQLCLFIGAAIVLLALVKAIPDMVGDMITGFSWGAGEPLTRSAMQVGKGTVGVGTAVTAGAAGGMMSVYQAAKLSNSTNSGFASKAAGTVSNLASAAKQDVAAGLSGKHKGQGTMGGRMAAILKEGGLTMPKSEIKYEPYYSDAPDLSKTGSIYKDKKIEGKNDE